MKHAPIFPVIAACSWAWLLPVCLGAEPPLYQRFRPVTELPWRDRSLSMEEILRRIFHDPNLIVRQHLLEEYLCTIPSNEFPRAFDLCIKLEEDDSPDSVLTILFRTWAQADPEAAWERCDQLIDTIFQQHLLDVESWDTGLFAVNLAAVRAADFWPQITHVDDFLYGLERSSLTLAKKAVLYEAAHARNQQYLANSLVLQRKTLFRGEPNQRPVSPWSYSRAPTREDHSLGIWSGRDPIDAQESRARNYALLARLFSLPPEMVDEELRDLGGSTIQDDSILSHAMIRWMNGDFREGMNVYKEYTQLIGWSFQKPDEGEEWNEPVPLTFIIEWAMLDPKAYLEWFAEHGRELTPRFWAVRQTLLRRLHPLTFNGGWPSSGLNEEDYVKISMPEYWSWAALDPQGSLPMMFVRRVTSGYEDFVYDLAYELGRDRPNIFRARMKAMTDFGVPLSDNALARLMEEWGEIDIAETARWGTIWCVRLGGKTPEQMVAIYRGKMRPNPNAVEGRHFSALRIWAYRKPDEVRVWIAGEDFDGEVKSALHWLVDHAEGGFEMREVQREGYKESIPVPPTD